MKPQNQAPNSSPNPQKEAPKSSWKLTQIGLLGAEIILIATIRYTYYKEQNSQNTVVEPTASQPATQSSAIYRAAQNPTPMAPMASRPTAPPPTMTLPDQVM